MTLAMPPEWAPHERCVVAWPCRADMWGDAAGRGQGQPRRGGERHRRLRAGAAGGQRPATGPRRRRPAPGAEVVEWPLDDSWARDIGAIVLTGDGRRAGLNPVFNGWGEKFDPYDEDARFAERMCEHLGLDRVDAFPFVLEGGAITVDGAGTVITTEQCLLNPNRNPGLDRAGIEAELRRWLGVERVVWLPYGLIEDDDTDGHVDNVALCVRPGVVLAQTTTDPSHADHDRLRANVEVLVEAGYEVIEIDVLPEVVIDGQSGGGPAAEPVPGQRGRHRARGRRARGRRRPRRGPGRPARPRGGRRPRRRPGLRRRRRPLHHPAGASADDHRAADPHRPAVGLARPGRRPRPAAVPDRRRAAPLARGPGRAPGRAPREREDGGRRRRPPGLPPGADPLALLRRHPRRAVGGRRHARAAARWAHPRPGRRAGRGTSTCSSTPRSTRTPATGASASTPPSASAPTASSWPAPASSTSRSPRATTRTGTSVPATAATRWSPSATPRSASPPAGTSGSPSWPGPTRWPGPRSSSTPPPSAPSPTTPTSTPSPCGRRSSSATAWPTAPSWSPSTASAPSRRSPSTARRFISDPYGRVLVKAPRDRARRARRRPRPRRAPGLAHPLPLPHHPPPRHLRGPHRAAGLIRRRCGSSATSSATSS